MKIIELNNISKIYGENESKIIALNSINLTINKGEFIGIMGPSGSGKSTLLNILGCIDSPSKGIYKLNNNNMSKLKEKELSRIRNKELGFIFQNFNILYDFNLLDNVTLPLQYSKNNSINDYNKAKKLLGDLGLKKHFNKTPDKLSGGQKQRVAIARALINEPKIILADEPTGALDQKKGTEIMNLLKELNKRGKTVIIITHDINIGKQCNRLIRIEDGKIVSDEELENNNYEKVIGGES